MEIKNDSLIMRQWDDMHAHLRTGDMLKFVARYTADVFARAVVMGNLPSPVVTAGDVKRYRDEILAIAPDFQPIMSVMLVNGMTPEILRKANQVGAKVLKLIPEGVSTNSDFGVKLEQLKDYYPVLKLARKMNMVFSGHWELDYDSRLGEEISAKEREFKAIPYLRGLINDIPGLKIVVEHVSDRRMVDLVKRAPWNVAATVTAHHLLYTYDDVYTKTGAIKNPHLVCKPIMKSWLDRKVIRRVVFGGNRKFFFGSDSAPTPLAEKISKIPPQAGIFNPFALPILAHIFEQFGVLDRLDNFVSVFGAEAYDLELNDGKIILKKEPWLVPCQIGEFPLVPLWAGQELSWKVV